MIGWRSEAEALARDGNEGDAVAVPDRAVGGRSAGRKREPSADLTIENNVPLVDLEGLRGLLLVNGTLRVEANLALASLEGLGGVTSVGGHMLIHANPSLTSLGLDSMTTVSGNLSVRGNADLDTCEATMLLGELDSPPASVCIIGNSSSPCDDVVPDC